jgi:uncharacterized protein (DUF2236 family)
MQIAHPKVAEGVANHSRFSKDPIGRLYQTMNSMWSILFDELPEAQASVQRVKQIHRRVQGTFKESDVLPAGTQYDAQDPDLLLWVHATLVDSAIVTYELFVKPLAVDDKREHYEETKKLAILLGVPEGKIPASLEDFHAYMGEMIESDTLSVGFKARSIAKEILHPKPLVLKIGGPLSAFITNGLLPPRLRREYDLTWNSRKESLLQFLAFTTRGILPFVPQVLRIVPQARAAQKRSASFCDRRSTQWQRSRHQKRDEA